MRYISRPLTTSAAIALPQKKELRSAYRPTRTGKTVLMQNIARPQGLGQADLPGDRHLALRHPQGGASTQSACQHFSEMTECY